MAARGVKPKPIKRLVDGTHRPTRHGKANAAEAAVAEADASFGKPVMPEGMEGEGAKAWKRYIAPAGWLDATREAAAIASCELWQEFRLSPTGFPTSNTASSAPTWPSWR